MLNLFGLAEMPGTGGGGVQLRKLVSPRVVHDAAALPRQESAPLRYQGIIRNPQVSYEGVERRVTVDRGDKVGPYQGYDSLVVAVVGVTAVGVAAVVAVQAGSQADTCVGARQRILNSWNLVNAG